MPESGQGDCAQTDHGQDREHNNAPGLGGCHALGLHDQCALHAGVGAPAAADVTIIGIRSHFVGRERDSVRAFWRCDDADSEGVDRPLVPAAAIGMVRIVQAGQAHGNRLADLDRNERLIKPIHGTRDVDHVARQRGQLGRRKGRNQCIFL